MSRYRTSDEVKKEHLEKLGPDLGPVYHALWNEFAWLRIKWQEYRELFGTNPERIDLMNSAASLFFHVVQNTLWDDILVHLCRLTDPPESFGKPNLSLTLFPSLLINDLELHNEVSDLVKKAISATAFARDWRNRHISHLDRALALDKGAQPLAAASRAQVSDALSAIHAVLNKISERLLDSTLSKEVITTSDGAENLLYVIRDGLEADAARQARIQNRQYTQDDLRHRAI